MSLFFNIPFYLHPFSYSPGLTHFLWTWVFSFFALGCYPMTRWSDKVKVWHPCLELRRTLRYNLPSRVPPCRISWDFIWNCIFACLLSHPCSGLSIPVPVFMKALLQRITWIGFINSCSFFYLKTKTIDTKSIIV